MSDANLYILLRAGQGGLGLIVNRRGVTAPQTISNNVKNKKQREFDDMHRYRSVGRFQYIVLHACTHNAGRD